MAKFTRKAGAVLGALTVRRRVDLLRCDSEEKALDSICSCVTSGERDKKHLTHQNPGEGNGNTGAGAATGPMIRAATCLPAGGGGSPVYSYCPDQPRVCGPLPWCPGWPALARPTFREVDSQCGRGTHLSWTYIEFLTPPQICHLHSQTDLLLMGGVKFHSTCAFARTKATDIRYFFKIDLCPLSQFCL